MNQASQTPFPRGSVVRRRPQSPPLSWNNEAVPWGVDLVIAGHDNGVMVLVKPYEFSVTLYEDDVTSQTFILVDERAPGKTQQGVKFFALVTHGPVSAEETGQRFPAIRGTRFCRTNRPFGVAGSSNQMPRGVALEVVGRQPPDASMEQSPDLEIITLRDPSGRSWGILGLEFTTGYFTLVR